MVESALDPAEKEGAPHFMVPRPFRIIRRTRETQDCFTLELEAADGRAELEFAPGQFNMLYVFGKGESAISISGDPMSPERLVHTIRAVGTVTGGARSLEGGDVVGVRGPFGTPWPLEAARGKHVLVIAGGIGLAPLRPVVHHVLGHRTEYGRATLLYGTRTPDDLLFRTLLQEWRARFDFEAHLIVNGAHADWRGQVGVVPDLIPLAMLEPTETVAMVCGPEIMMRYTVRELVDEGMDPADIYVTMERNMKCAVAQCGHCQLGPEFVCRDGPVFSWARIRPSLSVREL